MQKEDQPKGSALGLMWVTSDHELEKLLVVLIIVIVIDK